MSVITVVTDRGDVGIRIDRVLLRHLGRVPGITRNRLQRLIDAGAVQIKWRRVRRASLRVAAADVIEIDLPARKPPSAPVAETLPLDIRYEDDDLLIVNKPPGQVSHPAFRNSSGTLLNALLAHAADRWTPSLVSRLDKDTSGLVLIAKSKAIHTRLQQLAHDNGIEKDYLAIVAGKPPSRGTIDLALARDPWDQRRVVVRDRGGLPSVTRFQRLRSVACGPDRYVSLVRCRLITGRTHQIRVHLAARGWPIVGDATYKGGGVLLPREVMMTRQALHAWRLAFDHPVTQTRLEVTADPPRDMAMLLTRFDTGEAR